MNQETLDLERWTATWQSSPVTSAVDITAIRRRVRRYTAYAVGGWLFGVLSIVFITLLAVREPEAPVVVGAIAVWGFVLAAVLFDIRSRRGTWRSVGTSTRAYLELEERQLLARRRGFRFSWGLLAAEVAFFLFWIPWRIGYRPSAGPADYISAFASLIAICAIFVIGTVWLERRNQRSLRRVRDVLASLTSSKD